MQYTMLLIKHIDTQYKEVDKAIGTQFIFEVADQADLCTIQNCR